MSDPQDTVQPLQFSDLMLSDALTYSLQLYNATIPHGLALQNVVKVSIVQWKKGISIRKIVWVVLYILTIE